MKNKTALYRSRPWLTLALALLTAKSAHSAEPVRPGTPADAAVKLETVTVTGTNIRRTDSEIALPVTTFDRAELEARGVATMSELFETLGLAEPPAISELNVGPQDARGDVASVDLRGLGSGSTLVLINGRRMAPHPVSMAENGVPTLAPNINSIPAPSSAGSKSSATVPPPSTAPTPPPASSTTSSPAIISAARSPSAVR